MPLIKPAAVGMRIGWLDSCRQPSHIHRTVDGGATTVCGHPVKEMIEEMIPWEGGYRPRWILNASVPRKIHGESRYCEGCFKHGGKSLPFIKGASNGTG
jgi:hypothetical protein